MERTQTLRTRLGALALAFALALFSAGCNSGSEEPDAPAPEMPNKSMNDAADAATAEPNAPSEDVSTAVGDIDPDRFPAELPDGVLAELPSNFPEDLPVYPNAAPAQGRGGEVGGRELSAVQLLSNDSPSEARTFYERELAAKGWSIDRAEDQGVGVAISGSRQDCKVSIMIMPSDSGGSDIFTVSECGE